jgi:vacuolar-type H+-ATPase subunit I/STV1
MEESNMTTNRLSINAAIPIGIAIILLSILYYVFDIDGRGIWGYLMYALLLAGIIWGTIQLRDKHRGGILSYGQSFSSGALISLYTGIISAIYTFVFYKFFAPEQIQVLLERVEEEMLVKAPEMTDQQLDMALSMTEKFMTPIWMSITSLFAILIVGIIFSLIVSIFLKRDEPKQITSD